MLTKKDIKLLLPVIFIIGIFVYFSNPSNGPIIPCIFNKITGLFCPGCGMSRAVHSIFKFNFNQAIRYNGLILIIPPMLVFYYLLNNSNSRKLSKIILILMIVISLGYGFIRNTETFSYMSPTSILVEI